jgi:hypothetical protein
VPAVTAVAPGHPLAAKLGIVLRSAIPELNLDDVLRVNPYGWPEGFDIQLLKPTSA